MQNQSHPKISIITPSFNQAQFIEETINSVLSQQYLNLEYWVIDGGSTDNTIKILKKYNKHINWISEPDKGQTDAINKGLKRVSGDIIAYLNSDDVYLPNTLETVAEYFQNNPQAQWLTGDYYIIDENGKKIQSLVTNYKRWLRSMSGAHTLAIANYLIQPSTFWRKNVVKEIGAFDQSLRYCMDYDYWLRIITRFPIHVVPNHFSLFRIHGASKGGSQYDRQFAEEHEVMKRYFPQWWLRLAHSCHSALIVLAYRLLKG